MRKRIDRCVGCAECIGCYRKGSFYTALVCDYCEEEEDELYIDGRDALCKECLLVRHKSSEGECRECGEEGMLYDGLCEQCFMDDQERVRLND